MHPLRKVFDLYDSNMAELGSALAAAGGDSKLILQSDEFKEVMAVLAANNIVIEPRYVPLSQLKPTAPWEPR